MKTLSLLSFLSWEVWTGQRYAHLQCLKDMPCMTLGESLGVFKCCNDADKRGCNRIGVRESGEDIEGVGLSLSVQGKCAVG